MDNEFEKEKEGMTGDTPQYENSNTDENIREAENNYEENAASNENLIKDSTDDVKEAGEDAEKTEETEVTETAEEKEEVEEAEETSENAETEPSNEEESPEVTERETKGET